MNKCLSSILLNYLQHGLLLEYEIMYLGIECRGKADRLCLFKHPEVLKIQNSREPTTPSLGRLELVL